MSTAVNDYSYGTDTQKLSPYYSSSPHSTPTHLDDGYRSAENGVVYPRNQSLAGSFNSTSPSSRSHPVFERLADGQVVSGSLGEPIYVSSRRTPNKIETRADVFIESDSMGGQTYVKQTLEPSQNYGNGSPSKAANAEISLIDAEDVGFHRDGFGRKSISEKRHAHLDAKNTDTYQRNKKAKEQQQLLLQQQQQENIASAQETSNQASSSPERLSGRMNTSAKNTMLAGTSLPSPHHDLGELHFPSFILIPNIPSLMRASLASSSLASSRTRSPNRCFVSFALSILTTVLRLTVLLMIPIFCRMLAPCSAPGKQFAQSLLFQWHFETC